MDLKRILLVEDRASDIELTLSALDKHNLANQVVVTRDGLEALDYLRRHGEFANRPDIDPLVILLDLRLPKLDGLDVLRAIRTDASLRHLRVVVLSSSTDNPDLSEARRLGVEAYIVKPVQFHRFIHVVKDIGLRWVLSAPGRTPAS